MGAGGLVVISDSQNPPFAFVAGKGDAIARIHFERRGRADIDRTSADVERDRLPSLLARHNPDILRDAANHSDRWHQLQAHTPRGTGFVAGFDLADAGV